MKGLRKWWLGMFYLTCCFILDMTAISSVEGSMSLAEMGGLASLNASMATGLGVVIWGNVQGARAANGK